MLQHTHTKSISICAIKNSKMLGNLKGKRVCVCVPSWRLIFLDHLAPRPYDAPGRHDTQNDNFFLSTRNRWIANFSRFFFFVIQRTHTHTTQAVLYVNWHLLYKDLIIAETMTWATRRVQQQRSENETAHTPISVVHRTFSRFFFFL